jgi:hypothetical protein
LLKAHLALAVLSWVGFMVTVFAITFVVARWTDIAVSAWEQAARLPLWFAFGIGSHLGYTMLPLHITHGLTRRGFAMQALVFVIVFAAALAAMITAGFVIEAALYSATGWTQALAERHLFGSVRELHLVFLESWMSHALWAAGGAFIAAAFYRSGALGALAILAALFISIVAEFSLNEAWAPAGWALERTGSDAGTGAALGVPIYIACIALILGLAWLVVREIPIRSKAQ